MSIENFTLYDLEHEKDKLVDNIDVKAAIKNRRKIKLAIFYFFESDQFLSNIFQKRSLQEMKEVTVSRW